MKLLERRALGALAASLLLQGSSARGESLPFWGAEWASATKASFGAGVLLGARRGEGFTTVPNGALVQLQPGLGGGAVSVGWVPYAAAAQGLAFAGVAAKGTLLRTWGSPHGLPAGQTYAGASLHLAWVVKGSLGVLVRVGGHDGPRTVFAWSVGIGL